MPLKLSCSMCGANLVADDLAIRRGFITCDHCFTLLRITSLGAREYEGTLSAQQPPAGVLLTRSGPGEISITVPHSIKDSILFNRRQLITGALVGSAIDALSGLVFGLVSLVIGGSALTALLFGLAAFVIGLGPSLLIFGGITALVMSARQKHLKPVKLHDGEIQPSWFNQPMPSLAVREVRQLYTVQSKETGKRQTVPYITLAVYALMKNGGRTPLVKPIYSPEIALYVEETLEAEMGIFDLPVYGDVELPGQAGDAIPVPPVPSMHFDNLHCGGCGAELEVTPEALQRGFLVCAHCAALTLLYEPGTSKPILGMPDPDSPAFRYRVQEQAGRLVVCNRQDGRQVLSLDGGQECLEVHPAGAPSVTRSFAEISNPQVKVKLTAAEGERPEGWVMDFLKAMGEKMAYSGEIDSREVLQETIGWQTFWIGARTAGGAEIPLVEDIRDFREAFYLQGRIKAGLEKTS